MQRGRKTIATIVPTTRVQFQRTRVPPLARAFVEIEQVRPVTIAPKTRVQFQRRRVPPLARVFVEIEHDPVARWSRA